MIAKINLKFLEDMVNLENMVNLQDSIYQYNTYLADTFKYYVIISISTVNLYKLGKAESC